MPKALEHADLDLGERVRIRKVSDAYRSGSLSLDASVRQLVGLGYERGSAERYMDLVSSTCDHARHRPCEAAKPAFWERRERPW